MPTISGATTSDRPKRRHQFSQSKGLALGSASLARPDYGQANADAVVSRAWEAGIRYFDTAPMYGGGRAESLLGHALAGIPRDEFQLSSKVGRLVRKPSDTKGPFDSDLWRFDFSRDGVLRSIEESLQRLGTDRLDILYIHDPDQFVHQAVTEAFPTLAQLRDEGVVSAIGCGVTKADLLDTLVTHLDVDVVLLAERYSLVDDDGPSLALPQTDRRSVAAVIAAALHGGLVDGTDSGTFHYRPTPAGVVDRVARIAAVCRRHEVPIGAAALQYVLADPRVDMLLSGPATPEQLEQNISWSTSTPPQALWTDLNDEGLLPRPDYVLGNG